MKLNTTDFLRKCQHPLTLVLTSIPVAVIIIINCSPEMLTRMWLLPLACVLVSWGCILLPGKRRLLGGAFGAVLLMALGVTLLGVRTNFLLVLLPLIYATLLFVALPIGGWERGRELNVAWCVTGVVLYVLLQLLTSGSRRLGADIYGAAEMPVLLCFLAYACLILLALNRTSLDSAAMSRRTVPLLMRRQNLLITMALLVLGVLIAAIPAIGSTLSRVWDWLMQGVSYLAALLAALMPLKQQSGGSAAPADADQMTLGEANAPSALAVFLEKVLMVSVGILLVVIAVVVGRFLIKRLIRLVQHLWGIITQYSASVSEDYEDEITDTRDEPGVERSSIFGRLRRMAPADEKGMTPTERVRYRYKRMKQKHSEWSIAHTARETLPERAAAFYERARYGGETLTEDEAKRFSEDTRRL